MKTLCRFYNCKALVLLAIHSKKAKWFPLKFPSAPIRPKKAGKILFYRNRKALEIGSRYCYKMGVETKIARYANLKLKPGNKIRSCLFDSFSGKKEGNSNRTSSCSKPNNPGST